MRVLLISTYELGRPPFALASAAAFLSKDGAEVSCLDLSITALDEEEVRRADLVAFHLPMHTATRIALKAAARVRSRFPSKRLCFFGLYAPPNEDLLRRLGGEAVLGGEFEPGLARFVRSAAGGAAPARQDTPVISLERVPFEVPRRDGLAPLSRYARLRLPSGEERLAGATEASRGCRHLCRHCPIVPIYGGKVRLVPRHVVLEDVRLQVAAGARHITFGDPDFLNAPAHAMAIAEALHDEHPGVTFDVTAKIEHLKRRRGDLRRLRDLGCLFVTSAVESVEDPVLERLDKGHTRADFLLVVAACREAGLALHPTFVPFTPWTTIAGYRDLLALVDALDLVEAVAPLQLALRLLLPAGSLLLDLDEVRARLLPFDAERLIHPWRHPDPEVDALQADLETMLRAPEAKGAARADLFGEIVRIARSAGGGSGVLRPRAEPRADRAAIPWMTEPWYC